MYWYCQQQQKSTVLRLRRLPVPVLVLVLVVVGRNRILIRFAAARHALVALWWTHRDTLLASTVVLNLPKIESSRSLSQKAKKSKIYTVLVTVHVKYHDVHLMPVQWNRNRIEIHPSPYVCLFFSLGIIHIFTTCHPKTITNSYCLVKRQFMAPISLRVYQEFINAPLRRDTIWHGTGPVPVHFIVICEI